MAVTYMYYSIRFNGHAVQELSFDIQLSGAYNSCSISLPESGQMYCDLIDSVGYVEAVFTIDGQAHHFIIDKYTLEESYSGKTIRFDGLSRTSFCDLRYTEALGDLTFGNTEQLFVLLDAIIAPYGITITRFPSLPLTNTDIEVKDKAVIEVLEELAEITGLRLYTSTDGLSLRFATYRCNLDDIPISTVTVDRFYEIMTRTESVEVAVEYTAVDIFGAGEESTGELILETDELTPTEYLLRVYSMPLINTMSSVSVTTSDGRVTTVAVNQTESVTELLDFNEGVASLKYPVLSMGTVTWYNLSNTLNYTVGSRDISLVTTDDLAVAEVNYTTIRNVYRISGLTEPLVKIKVEAVY